MQLCPKYVSDISAAAGVLCLIAFAKIKSDHTCTLSATVKKFFAFSMPRGNETLFTGVTLYMETELIGSLIQQLCLCTIDLEDCGSSIALREGSLQTDTDPGFGLETQIPSKVGRKFNFVSKTIKHFALETAMVLKKTQTGLLEARAFSALVIL